MKGKLGILAGVAAALMVAVALSPAGSAARMTASEKANCSGDPCATAKCSAASASAHAVGSEHAWASAEAGTFTASSDGSPSAHADAAGGSPTSASAKGKKDWSLKEANASCSGGSDTFIMNAGLTVGCLADDKITSTGSFLGRVYVAPQGLIAYDEARNAGLRLQDTDLLFDGTSLLRAAPMDVSGLVATGSLVGLDFVDGADQDTCSVSLS